MSVASLLAAGCATAGRRSVPSPVSSAIVQPFEDLNLTGEDASTVLISAKSAPYRVPISCIAGNQELTALDQALGPDLTGAGDANKAEVVAGDVIRSVAHLPFRGVVRRLTGAARREEARRAAVKAGLLRRGYLAGWLTAEGCASGRDRRYVAASNPAASEFPSRTEAKK